MGAWCEGASTVREGLLYAWHGTALCGLRRAVCLPGLVVLAISLEAALLNRHWLSGGVQCVVAVQPQCCPLNGRYVASTSQQLCGACLHHCMLCWRSASAAECCTPAVTEVACCTSSSCSSAGPWFPALTGSQHSPGQQWKHNQLYILLL